MLHTQISLERYLLVLGLLVILSTLSSRSLASAQGITDLDDDGLEDAFEDSLMRRFAPVVKLHPDERYMPANVDWFLPRVHMRFNRKQGCPDQQILDKGEIIGSMSLLGHSERQTSKFWPFCDHKGKEHWSGPGDERSEFFLQISDGSTRLGSSDPLLWTCYAHVMRSPAPYPDMYDIQYHFFYPYNGPLPGGGAHQGDWEHVTVRVNPDLRTLHGIYFAAHNREGQWYQQQSASNQGYALTADNRPFVYSAMNSHASYPWAGKWSRKGWLPDDHTGDGQLWDCQNNIVNLGEKTNPSWGLEWLQYTGRWGRIGRTSNCNSDFPDLSFCGPYGPAFKTAWSEGDPLDGDNPDESGQIFDDFNQPLSSSQWSQELAGTATIDAGSGTLTLDASSGIDCPPEVACKSAVVRSTQEFASGAVRFVGLHETHRLWFAGLDNGNGTYMHVRRDQPSDARLAFAVVSNHVIIDLHFFETTLPSTTIDGITIQWSDYNVDVVVQVDSQTQYTHHVDLLEPLAPMPIHAGAYTHTRLTIDDVFTAE